MTGSVKNIIFDFGGVIFNIDHKKVERAFKSLGLSDFESLFNQASQTEIFKDFETGAISPEAFRTQLKNISGLKVSDDVLDQTWNEILCDYPPHRIEMLKMLSENYRLFLLSNTNSIHYNHYIDLFKEQYGYNFISLFEETFWSFKIGKRKPDPDPYTHILNKLNLIPEETLFIDDSLQNIKIAEKLNIVAFHLDQGMDVTELFNNGFLKQDLYE